MGANNSRHVGLWHGVRDIQALVGELYPGDRLEFRDNILYSHWGIYVGRYQGMRHAVIHFSMSEGGSKFFKQKTSGSGFFAKQKPDILADTIHDIMNGSGKVRINNSTDDRLEPLDPEIVIEKAAEMHHSGTPMDYSLLYNNCEHFVNLCRYGHSLSHQSLDTFGLNNALYAVREAVLSDVKEVFNLLLDEIQTH